MNGNSDAIHVLYVGSDPGKRATFLESVEDRLRVDSETGTEEALDHLTEENVDCVVSEHSLPDGNGLELLTRARRAHRDIPFILFVEPGNEEVAIEAISADVTDYVKKEGSEQQKRLAYRIVKAVRRHRASQEAKKTERRFQILTETTNDILWMFTPDFRELLFVNSAYEEIWGRSADTLAEEPTDFLKGVHPEARGTVQTAMEKLSRGESIDLEYRVNPRENFGRWVWVQGEPVYDEEETLVAVAGFGRDITERKVREEELRRSERQFGAVLNDPQSLVGVLDTDGTVLHVNDTALEIAGVDRSQIEGTPFPDTPWWSHDENLQSDLREWIARAADGEYVTFEAEHPVEDDEWMTVEGSLRPVTNEDGTVVSLIASGRDITERTNREDQLRALSEATEELPLAQTPDEVAARVVDIAEEVLDQPVTALWRHDAGQNLLVPWIASEQSQALAEKSELGEMPTIKPGSAEMGTFQQREPRYITDYQSIDNPAHPNVPLGSLLLFPIGGYGLLNVGSTETNAFAEADRNLISILASNAAAAFQRAEREQALERFASMVSHDLRSPLNIAKNRVLLAQEARESDHLESAIGALGRMETIVEGLLALALQGQPVEETEEVTLSAVADRCWQLTDGERAELVVERDTTFQAGADRLQELFENLFRNAIEHGSDDVTIQVGSMEETSGFYVADDGSGIPEEERDEIFDFGYTTDEEGTGIGLAIVQEIAEAHGWTCNVTDSEEGGTRFEFRGVST